MTSFDELMNQVAQELRQADEADIKRSLQLKREFDAALGLKPEESRKGLCPKEARKGWPCTKENKHRGRCCDGVSYKYKPETLAIGQHYYQHISPKARSHRNYKYQEWFPFWDPKQGGSLANAREWFRNNLPKPGPGYELHVIKSLEHPYGYFGPGWLKWVHKMDRHDKDLTALATTWTNEQWEEFKRQEDNRRGLRKREF
jgi:hypothetical protein